jgi:hypothetical protein
MQASVMAVVTPAQPQANLKPFAIWVELITPLAASDASSPIVSVTTCTQGTKLTGVGSGESPPATFLPPGQKF